MNSKFQNNIALVLIAVSLFLMIILVVVSFSYVNQIWDYTGQKQFSAVQYIFGAFLPLIGTWMGTILAYYFTKENFESANQNTQKLLSHITSSQKLESIKASEIMIKFSGITYEEWDDSTIKSKKISEIIKIYEIKKVNRLPFLNKDRSLKYIIHKSVFESFLSKELITEKVEPTVEFFLTKVKSSYPDLQAFLDSGAGFIGLEANLKEAQEIMEKNNNCKDVFITATGNKTEMILGWVTNGEIERNARI